MACPAPAITRKALLRTRPLWELCGRPSPLFPRLRRLPRLRRPELLRTRTWFEPAPLPPLHRRLLPSLLDGLVEAGRSTDVILDSCPSSPASSSGCLGFRTPPSGTPASSAFATPPEGSPGAAHLSRLLEDRTPSPRAQPPARPPTAPPGKGSVLCANLNALVPKMDRLEALLRRHDALACLLQETKICDKTPQSLLSIRGFSLHRKDRTANGGGVAIYTATSLHGLRVRSRTILPSDHSLEAVGAAIRVTGFPELIVASVYRPPSQTTTEAQCFRESLETFLAELLASGSPLIVGGDMNRDLGEPEALPLEKVFCGFDLVPLNTTEPTRARKRIDWLLSNATSARDVQAATLGSPLENGPAEASHAVLRTELRLSGRIRRVKPSFSLRWRWSDADAQKAAIAYHAAPSSAAALTAASPDEALRLLAQSLDRARDAGVPRKRCRDVPLSQPSWVTPVVLEHLDRADEAAKALRRLLHNGASQQHLSKAKAHLKRVTKQKKVELARAQKSHQDLIWSQCQAEKSLWGFLERVNGKEKRGVESLVVGGRHLSEPSLIAQALRDSFTANFQVDPLPLPPRATEPSPVPASAHVNIQQTRELLKGLKGGKAAGRDGLPSSFLLLLCAELAPALTLLLNQVVSTQECPTPWKAAWMSPVPKSPTPAGPEDYRPVSILPALSKIFEKRLCQLLEGHLREPDLSPNQFAYARACGTADALGRLQQILLAAAPTKRSQPCLKVAVLSLDLSKAFDRLPHSTVVRALRRRGCPTWLENLVRAWLEGRRACVRVDGTDSADMELPSGVPQGSLSGPLLFGLATDSALRLPFGQRTECLAYADDTLLVSDVSTPALEEQFRADAALLAGHLHSLGLQLNLQKSALLVCSQGSKATCLSSPLLLQGHAIGEVSEFRWLGVLIDRRMSFNSHWKELGTSTKRAVGALGRAVRWEPERVRHLVAERLCPKLSYSLGPCSPSSDVAWRAAGAALSFTARRLSGEWRMERALVLQSAGLPSAKELAAKAIIGLAYDCVFRGRRVGRWMEEGLSEAELRQVGRRGERALPPAAVRPFLLVRPTSLYSSQDHLLPVRLPRLWRAAVEHYGEGLLAHSKKTLLQSLPPALFSTEAFE